MGPITGPFPASSIPAIIIFRLPPDLKEESFLLFIKVGKGIVYRIETLKKRKFVYEGIYGFKKPAQNLFSVLVA
jgi:hypothetical protein